MEKTRKAGRPRSFDPDQALDQALLVFWEHGYEGASMASLQAATGLTAPALYRAFDSKERLFELAVRRYQERYAFAARSDLPFAEAIAHYLDRAAREFTTDPGRGCLVSTGLLATGRDSELAAAVVRAERDQALANLRGRIIDARARGELPPTTDTEGLARTIGALIQGMSVQARDGAGYRELATIATAARDLLPTDVPGA
ncbi:TetR/AcrR family transcriptional regulator [Spiractinospora alimapuensis]|uniref:TetR/AcrR family transcriptional regulator n=1 Tax=Spiractinospora alimapuensis TaxID=2820884 RepID=UPI001F3C1198|nr:TetR/AcrR family transcriptional regulator [Spiractinospora alimapuensis]QVQ50898.1 TetR/AcrR family transcriptional regulator [Spiractinospora alimapuensis]